VANDTDPFAGVSPTLPHDASVSSDDPFSGVATPHGDAFTASPMPQAQDNSWLRYPRLMKQELIGGAKDVINLPGQLTKLGEQYLPNILTRPIGSIDLHHPFSEPDVPVAANPFPSIDTSRSPDLIPSGIGENLLAGGLRGVGGAALTMGVGGAASLAGRSAAGMAPVASDVSLLAGQGAKALLSQGALPGAAGEAISQALPDSVDPRIKSALTMMTGGLTAIGSHALLSGNPIGNVASIMGKSENAQQAGEAAQDAIRDWKTNVLPQKLNALSAPLDAKVPATAPVALSNFESTLTNMTSKAGALQPMVNLLQSRLPSQLLDKLQGLSLGSTGPINVSWQDARALRSAIGDLIANPKLMGSADPNMVKGLYKSLSEDLGSTATANGAGSEWNEFNCGSNRLYSIGENTLSKIASDVNPVNEKIKPEDAATKFWNAGKKGATDLANLRSEVPGAADELAAGLLRSSPEKWSTLPDESKVALIPSPYARDALESAMPALHKMSPLSGIGHIAGAGVGA
jgi:hypothetical protein